ncbi:hypothetical protein BGW38_005129 [Lunasporangiospora selenospora]|uniref:C2H2-type domain-containing protein n=1 Tax=Lunasporangiospora selenospora TaxID=979761 RepID=A0A9P6FP73_9FUNG|nr:hypothetical protein BGW38_005129 [Lunasporangiospora selenospora]
MLASVFSITSDFATSTFDQKKAQTNHTLPTFYQSDPTSTFSSLNPSHSSSFSPTMSACSLSPSPAHSPSLSASPSSILYAQQQQHHHLQILGNHPASPNFLDLPADSFMIPVSQARPNQIQAQRLFSDCDPSMSEFSQDCNSFTTTAASVPTANSLYEIQYSTVVPTADDCQASVDYIYSHPQQQMRFKSEDLPASPNGHFVSAIAAAAAVAQAPTTYMLSTMARSFSDSQISDLCSALPEQVGMELCDSPMMYSQGRLYNTSHSLYSSANCATGLQQNHHHSYSTSSLSTLSEDSSSVSMSPRSPFSSTAASTAGSLSQSSSCNSLASTFALTRTMSEQSLPIFHNSSLALTTATPTTTAATTSTPASSAATTAATTTTGASMMSMSMSMSGLVGLDGPGMMMKPTPKRSRGRRVASFPDTASAASGCKVFTCRFDDCGKIFKRSEHLKRHVRSIHTLEKPFECPIPSCPKRFSRSDNLNQHIRIHRSGSSGLTHGLTHMHPHGGSGLTRSNSSSSIGSGLGLGVGIGAGDKNSKAYATFTPFLQSYSTELLTI